MGLRFTTTVTVTPEQCESGTLRRTTKAGMLVELPLSPDLLSLVALSKLNPMPPDTPVISRLAGRHNKTPSWLFRWWTWKKKCGIRKDLRPHDLRRTLARALYTETHDLLQVQRVLGHRTLSSTLHYLTDATKPLELPALTRVRLGLTKG
jgi:integrase